MAIAAPQNIPLPFGCRMTAALVVFYWTLKNNTK
jgi:hypothetical protein